MSIDWIFKGLHYSAEMPFSQEQFRLLILEDYERMLNEVEKEERFWATLKQKHDNSDTAEKSSSRPHIPESVRIEVWRRDGGKCTRCGSREKLEFDHIIPLSRGGSNTARNIELLCEKCNRSKGANIA